MALTALYGSNKPNKGVSNENFVNNEEMMMMFSIDKVPEGKPDFWSDKYLNNLERSYYGQNLSVNGTLPVGDKLEEKVEEVKPIIIGSEKSDHNSKINIVFITCDLPNIGGAATNTYNMIKEFKGTKINCHGIFISNVDMQD